MDVNNQYGLFESQKKLLKLMSTFDLLCRENNVVYCADSGTLLGAIRHNGFIPWDDDLDVVVTRDNYNRLMQVDFSKYGLKYKRKVFIESLCFDDESENDASLLLDIFTIDNTPDSVIRRKMKIARIIMIHGLWHYYAPTQSVTPNSIIKRLYSSVFKFFGRFYTEEQIFMKFQKISKEDNGRDTSFVQCFNYLTRELHVLYPKDILDKVVRHKFETIEINVPTEYDVYLTNLYGDYMTPVKTK